MKKLIAGKKALNRSWTKYYFVFQLSSLSLLFLTAGCGVTDLITATPAVSGNSSMANPTGQPTNSIIIVPLVTTPAPTSIPAPTSPATAFVPDVLPTVTALPPTPTDIPPTATPSPTSQPVTNLPLSPTPKPAATPTLVLNQDVPFFEDINDPVGVIKSYYNAINRKEYERAYSYFETPGAGVNAVRPAYPQFVQGYANTASVVLTTGPTSGQGAAGSTFADIPVVLVATNTNRSKQTFFGCYTTRRPNPAIVSGATWHIYTARLKSATASAAMNSLLSQGCK